MKKLFFFFAPVFLTVFSLALASCSRDEENNFPPFEAGQLGSLTTEEKPVPAEEALAVVAASPQGDLVAVSEGTTLAVTFNQPVVEIDDKTQMESASGEFSIEPKVKGNFRWLGSRTHIFTSEEELPYSKTYTVTVNKNIKSLSGKTMRDEYRFTFETPRPQVLRAYPYNETAELGLEDEIVLRFNQRASADFMNKISVTDFGGATFKMNARTLTPDEVKTLIESEVKKSGYDYDKRYLLTSGKPENLLFLKPAQKMTPGATYTVKFDDAKHPFTSKFSPYKSFAFTGGNTLSVQPEEGIRLDFSNQFYAKDLYAHLSISPKLTLPDTSGGFSYSSRSVYLNLDFKPGNTYTLTMGKDVADRWGNKLGKEVSVKIAVGDYEPQASIVQGYGVVENDFGAADAKTFPHIPVRGINVSSVTVESAVLSPEAFIARNADGYSEDGLFNGVKPVKGLSLKSHTIPVSPKRNVGGVHRFDLRAAFNEASGNSVSGLVFLQMQRPPEVNSESEYNRYQKALIQLTSLGVAAKYAATGSLALVTTLKDGKAVGGATVSLYQNTKKIWTGGTDNNGVAKIPSFASLGMDANADVGTLYVFAEKEGQIAYTSSDYQDGIEPYRFGINYESGFSQKTLLGKLYTERGIYRAGETVFFKGVVRSLRNGKWVVPAERTHSYTVTDSRGTALATKSLTIDSDYGSFADSVQLKPNASLGYYSISLNTEAPPVKKGRAVQPVSVASESFRVEAYRPATFATNVRTAKKEFIVGEKFDATVEGRYLFGAAMGGDKAKWTLTRSSASNFSVDNYDGYFWQSVGWNKTETDRTTDALSAGEGILDKDGQLKVSLPLKQEIAEPSLLLLEGEVQSSSRQTVAGSASAVLHPAEFYIGIKPSTTFTAADQAVPFDVVALSAIEKKMQSQSVQIEIVHRQWLSVRQAGAGGRYEWVTEQVDSTVFKDNLSTTSSAAVSRSFTPKAAGIYFLRGQAQDGKGNTARTEAYLYVYGKSYVAWERFDDDRITLTPSKTSYKPGETATLLVQSPYESATCLMTIEREGIIETKTFELSGTAPSLKIPITEAHLPNIYVSVMLIKGRTAAPGKEEDDPGKPSFKIGYMALSVDAGTKHLSTEVKTNKPDYFNGEEVEVEVFVKNAAGQGVASEVTLAAVDAGVLNLIGYSLPDLFNDFYAERPLGVKTSQSLLHLIGQRSYGEKGEARGGGGGEGGAGVNVRSKFITTPYWNPRVITGADGKATVRFKLPDNLTTFRIMAAAQTKDASFGTGKTDITVSRPLTLLAALPRFLRIGDTFEAGVVVYNYTKARATIKINADVKGALRLTSDAASSVSLEANASKEVRFKYAVDTTGLATFTFKATGDNSYSDALEQTLAVQQPYTKETLALFGSTENSVAEKLKIPKNTHAGLGSVTVQAASTALVGLREATEYLFEYPYGCLEQRASKILPLILAGDLIQTFSLETFKNRPKGIERKIVDSTLALFEKYQTYSGGFSYWTGDPMPYDYVTVYGAYTMTQAKAKGFKIDDAVLSKALNYLEQALKRSDETRYGLYTSQITKAWALYTLALNGRFDNSAAELLYQNRVRIPLDAKAYLMRAYAVQSKNPAAARLSSSQPRVRELAQSLLNLIKVENATAHFEDGTEEDFIYCFGSNVKTTANVFVCLMDAGAELPMADKVVAWLMQAQKNGRWRTTQENIFVLDALNTYFRKYESVTPDFKAKISIAGNLLLEESFKGRSLAQTVKTSGIEKFAKGEALDINVGKEGAGKLFYGLRVSYYPTYAVSPRDNGISVMKTVLPLGSKEKPREYAAGELVKITLRIAVPQERNFVAVDDPLPAGLEAVNPTLLTSARTIFSGGGSEGENGEGYEGEGSEGGEGYDDGSSSDGSENYTGNYEFDHIELKDDRVTLFAERLSAGLHTYTYLARATTYGTFTMPPTYTEEMYRPEVFGRTATKRLIIGERKTAQK